MALGSAAAYAVYILLSDRLLRDADPMALAAYLTAGAATSFFVAGGVLGSLGTVGGPAGLACLVGAALVGSVFAVTSFLKGVRLVGPSTASLLVTVEVPVTIALAAVVLKQHLTPTAARGSRARRRGDRDDAAAAPAEASARPDAPAELPPALAPAEQLAA